MAQLLNAVITVGIVDFGGGTVIYGYNSAGIGSINNATQNNGPVVAVCQWNSANQTLQLNYTSSFGNAKFGRIVVGTTPFYRTSATFTAGSPDRWNWTTATNPFGTVSGALRNFDIFYEDPDTTVSVIAPTEISLSDTQFPVTVDGIGVSGENVYGVGLDGNDISERTGIAPFLTTTNTNAPTVTFEVTSNLPSSGQTRTYYLYAARTGATGGAGGSTNEGVAAWVYSGITFQVTRSSTDNVNITPEARPAASYGFRAYNSSGNVVVEHSSRVPRFVASGSQTVSANSTSDVSISGITADGKWLVFLIARTAASSAIALFSETIFTGYFRIYNNANQSRDFDYWVVNIG